MKYKSEFKHSKGREEGRVMRIAEGASDFIRIMKDCYVCLTCGNIGTMSKGEMGQLYLPHQCFKCRTTFGKKYDFCCPDGILSTEDGKKYGILLVNEEEVHGKDSVVARDSHQIELLRARGYPVFILADFEINRMTDSSIRLWLYGAQESLAKMFLSEAIYNGEKDYRCLL